MRNCILACLDYEGRFDLNYDSFVDIVGDISRLTAVFGATC